jgi:hypothetical protein
VLVDVDFSKAKEVLQHITQPSIPEDDEIIQKLLDEGMPQRRKEKKARNMDEM